MARHDGEARWQALMQAHGVDVALEQLGVPEHRQVVEDRIVLSEGHVVRQARPGHRDRHIGGQLAVAVDHAVVHIGCGLGIVEEHQLAGRLVDLGVGRYAVERNPAGDAGLLQGLGIELVALAALVEGREGLAGVHHHIGARTVLERAVGAEATAHRQAGRIGQAAPQRGARLLLGLETAGAHEAVTIAGPATLEVDLADHPIAVERVVAAQRLMHLVLGVAQIDAVDVGRDRALDHLEVVGVDLLHQRRPGAAQIGVVAGLQRGEDRREPFDAHGFRPGARTLAGPLAATV